MLATLVKTLYIRGKGEWGIINIWGFISYCRGSPRVFNFLFPFGTSPSRSGETDFLVSTLI